SQPRRRGYADALAVAGRALAAHGPKALLEHRIVHNADQHVAVAVHTAQADAEARHAVYKIIGTVQWIDPPRRRAGWRSRGRSDAFFPRNVARRESVPEQVKGQGLTCPICFGD